MSDKCPTCGGPCEEEYCPRHGHDVAPASHTCSECFSWIPKRIVGSHKVRYRSTAHNYHDYMERCKELATAQQRIEEMRPIVEAADRLSRVFESKILFSKKHIEMRKRILRNALATYHKGEK